MIRTIQFLTYTFLIALSIPALAQCPLAITGTGTAASSCEGSDAVINMSVISPTAIPAIYGAQANPNPNIAIPDGSLVGASSSLVIGGAPPGSTILNTTDITALLNIPNNWCSDLDIYLVGPAGCGTLELSTDNGGGGKDYIGTVISTNNTTSILLGAAPFTGNFAPEGAVNLAPNFVGQGVGAGNYTLPAGDIAGCPINGTWTLWVFDDVLTDVGEIDSWSLNIGNCGYSYIYTATLPATVSTITNSTNTMTSSATISSLPVGVNTVNCTITNGSGTTIVPVPVKKFDIPVINLVEVSPNCVVGANGVITVTTQPINNANFTGADIGSLQFSLNGTTWQASNVFSGISAGPYLVRVRNSASVTCLATQEVILVGAPTITPSALVIQLCETVPGPTNSALSAQSTGGPPGIVNFNQFSACSSNCTAPDNDVLPFCPFSQAVTISGAGSSTITPTTIVSVNMNIDCGWFSDLDIFLVGPNNCGTLELATDIGGTANNFVNITVTSDQSFPNINTITAANDQLQTNLTFSSENTISTAPALNYVFPTGQFSNSSAPGNFGNSYLSTPSCFSNPAFPNAYMPNLGLQGCPVNGAWSLVIVDDWVAIPGTLNNFTLNIGQADPFYTTTMTTTEPGVTLTAQDQIPAPATTVTGTSISFNGSGANAFLAPAQALNLPIGLTDVIVETFRGGCSSPQKTITLKVYDRPSNLTYVAACATAGNPATVTFSSAINNADFTGVDVGVVQYSTSLSGPWTPITTPAVLAPGSYVYYLRNSASPGATGAASCTNGPFTVTVGTGIIPTITINNPIVNCNQTTVNLTATPNTGYTPSYLWTTTQTTQTIAITPTAATQYCVTVTNSANTACTASKCQTVTPTFTGTGPAPTAFGDSVCISGNVSLGVLSPCVGGTLNWYTTPTGGSSVFTGNPFNTSISSNTNYYVECVQGPCVSARALVPALVFPTVATPSITVSPNPACNDQDPIFTVSAPLGGLYVYQWYVNGVPQLGAPAASTSWTWTTPVDGALVTVEALYYFGP